MASFYRTAVGIAVQASASAASLRITILALRGTRRRRRRYTCSDKAIAPSVVACITRTETVNSFCALSIATQFCAGLDLEGSGSEYDSHGCYRLVSKHFFFSFNYSTLIHSSLYRAILFAKKTHFEIKKETTF